MKFYTYGKREDPVIVMLGGSFCPASAMAYLYEDLARDHYIIVPEYNGHYEGTTFTTRQGEALEVAGYLIAEGISSVQMLYGMSMGAEVGIELLHQLLVQKITVQSAFWDGAPCIKLSAAYKKFMYFKFKTMLNMMREKSVDEVIGWEFLNQFTNGRTESLRPMLTALKQTIPYLTEESIQNETECCYTFDYPEIPEEMQKKMHFFYAREEKAYKTCFRPVFTAYPKANYRVVDGQGHMTYSIEQKDKYLAMLRKVCA